MRQNLAHKQRLILFLCFFLILSCDKEEEEIKTFPVQYLLSEDHKELLEDYALDDVITFISNTKDSIQFKAGSLVQKLTYNLNEVRRGEELVLYYTCQSNYLETFKIGYQLAAISDSTSQLSLTTISGDLVNTDRGQLYDASYAKVNIPTSADSIFNSVPETPLKYAESLTLGSYLLKETYIFDKLGSFGQGPLSTYITYNKEYGILAFDTNDGKAWIMYKNNMH